VTLPDPRAQVADGRLGEEHPEVPEIGHRRLREWARIVAPARHWSVSVLGRRRSTLLDD
jgi:hypothetical protein